MVKFGGNGFGSSGQRPAFKPPVVGDPNFVAGRYDPNALFPEEAAQQRLQANMGPAQELQGLMSQLGLPENEKLAQIGEKGYIPPEPSFFEKLIGAASTPFQLVNTGIQDILNGPDQNATGEDYLRILGQGAQDLGNLVPGVAALVPNKPVFDAKEFTKRTGMEPLSGSLTLGLAGIPEQKTWYGKLGRGLLDFTYQVVADPVSWVTGGAAAVGRKQLGEHGIAVAQKIVDRVLAGGGKKAAEVGTIATGGAKTALEKEIAKKVEKVVADEADVWVREGMSVRKARWAARHDPGVVARARQEGLNHVYDQVMGPLLDKDFSKLAEVMGDNFDELPMFMQGGLRLTLPFGGRRILEGGVYIPGTRGLGRKIVGQPLRSAIEIAAKTPGLEPIAIWARKLKPGTDVWRALIDGTRSGELKGQHFAMFRDWVNGSALDANLTDAATALNAGQERLVPIWNKVSNRLNKASAGADYHIDDMYKILTDAFSSNDPTRRAFEDSIRATLGGGDDVEELIVVAKQIAETRQKYFKRQIDALVELVGEDSELGRAWRAMEDAVPQQMTSSGKRMLEDLSQSSAVFEDLDQMVEAGGVTGFAATVARAMVDGVSKGGRIEAQLAGGAGRAAARRYGEAAIMFLDSSDVLMMPPNLVSRDLAEGASRSAVPTVIAGQLNNRELNDAVEGVFKSLAEKYHIRVRGGAGAKGFRPFEENPLQSTFAFLTSSTAAAKQLSLAKMLEDMGLIRPGSKAIDYQKAITKLGKGVEEARPKLEAIAEMADEAKAAGKTVKVDRKKTVGTFSRIVGRKQRTAVDLTAEEAAALGEGRTVHHGLMEINDPSDVHLVDKDVSDEVLADMHGVASVDNWVAGGHAVEIVDPSVIPVPDLGLVKSREDRLVVRGAWARIPAPKRRVIEERVLRTAASQGKTMVEFVEEVTGRVVQSIPVGVETPTLLGLGEKVAEHPENYEAAVAYVKNMLGAAKTESETVHIGRHLADVFGEGDMEAGRRAVNELLQTDPALVDASAAVNEFFETWNELLAGRVRKITPTEPGKPPFLTNVETKHPEVFGQYEPTDYMTLGGELTKDDMKLIERMKKLTEGSLKDAGIDPSIYTMTDAEKVHVRGPDGFVNVEAFQLGGETLQGKQVEKHVAQFLHQIVYNQNAIYSPLGIAQLKETSSAVLRWWKGMATVTRPTFHIRNLLGGVWNNQIIGVRPRDYLKVRNSMLEFRAATSGKNALEFEEGLLRVSNKEMRPIIREAYMSGLLNSSFSRAEYRNVATMYRESHANLLQLANPINADKFGLVQGGSWAMESIEDFLRMAAFTAWYDPAAKSQAVAREMALMAHFNYSELTRFETGVKNFVPFFVWTRRNLPLQLQVMIERPALMNRYAHLMQSVKGEFSQNLPQDDFAGSQYWSAQVAGTDVVLNEGTPFWARIMFDPDLPINDLLDMDPLHPKETRDHLMGLLGPQFSTALQLLKQEDYGDVNMPAPLNQVTRQLAIYGLWDDEKSGRIPYSIRTIFNTLMPWYKEVVESPIGPSDPGQAAALGAPGTNAFDRIMLTLGKGVGLRTQTPGQSKSAAFNAQEFVRDQTVNLRKGPLLSNADEEERFRLMSSGQ